MFEVSIHALTDPCRSDLHKIYYDDESYNMGHGHAYEHLGIDPVQGAIIIVRPDQCKRLPAPNYSRLLIFCEL